MGTITYCKGLPTPASEMNSLGFTNLEMLLTSFAPIFHASACETVSHLLCASKFNKSNWNTHLQQTYGILKRHANGVISFARMLVDSAAQCRANHIKTLTGKLKSIEKWIAKIEKKLKNASLFYAKKNWRNSKTGCCFPLSCSLQFRSTNWRNLRFQLHNKKRRRYQLTQQIEHLKAAPYEVKVPRHQVFIVGSKDETQGNQICQWDGNELKFRVPSFLEPSFGKYVSSQIGNFERNINRLPFTGAKTWHFYRKNDKWCVAVQFTPTPVTPVSRNSSYGCIGIDMNPGSIGWAYCDGDGNLKAHGQIPLQMGLPKGKQHAQIVDACLQLATLAATTKSPIVCEELDFLKRKTQLDQVVYSLIRTKDKGIAEELYFRLLEGEQTFAELAYEYSEGLEANVGGRIGPVELGTLPKILAQVLSMSQLGQLFPPMRLGDWLVIVRLEKLIPAQLNQFMHQRLLRELFEAWLQEQLSQLSR